MQLTLARRLLERLARRSPAWRRASPSWARCCPRRAPGVAEAEQRREETARARSAAESRRADIAARLAGGSGRARQARGDLALAAERLGNADARRAPGGATSGRQMRAPGPRRPPSSRRRPPADRGAAGGEHERIRAELAGPRRRGGGACAAASTEQRERGARAGAGRSRLQAQTLRSLEGERAALEGELASLRERATAGREPIAPRCAGRAGGRGAPARPGRWSGPASMSHEPRRAGGRGRGMRDTWSPKPASARRMTAPTRRQAEETLAQLTARRQGARGAGARPSRAGARGRGAARRAGAVRSGVLGPLSDFVSTRSRGCRAGRAAARRLDARGAGARRGDAVRAIQAWHAEQQPGRTGAAARSIPGPRSARAAPTRWTIALRAKGLLRRGCRRPARAPRSSTRRAASFAVPAARCSSSGAGTRRGPLRRRAELGGPRFRRSKRAGAPFQAAEAALAGDARRSWRSGSGRCSEPWPLRRRPRGSSVRPSARGRTRRAHGGQRDVASRADSESQLERLTRAAASAPSSGWGRSSNAARWRASWPATDWTRTSARSRPARGAGDRAGGGAGAAGALAGAGGPGGRRPPLGRRAAGAGRGGALRGRGGGPRARRRAGAARQDEAALDDAAGGVARSPRASARCELHRAGGTLPPTRKRPWPEAEAGARRRRAGSRGVARHAGIRERGEPHAPGTADRGGRQSPEHRGAGRSRVAQALRSAAGRRADRSTSTSRPCRRNRRGSPKPSSPSVR